MFRRINPLEARAVAETLVQTGATIAALTGRIRPLVPELGHLQEVDRSVAWWEAAAGDLERRIAELGPAPPTLLHPELIQGPPLSRHTASPNRAAEFFAGLSPLQSVRIAERFPDRVGPLDGAPPVARYRANHLLAVRYLADLLRRRRRVAGLNSAFASEDLPDLPRWTAAPYLGVPESAERQLADLDRRIADAKRWVSPDRQFLRFDPSEDGFIVEVLGTLESSQHVAVVIPGVGNTIANYEEGLRRSAVSLFEHGDRSDVSVVAWLGYDTPDNLLSATNRHPVEAAESLQGLLAGLDACVNHPIHTSIIGHSYGSLVAGQAVRAGGPADEVVFVGSAGVGVDHVAELGLPAATRVWTGRAASDPIRLAADFRCFDPLPICYPSEDRLYFGLDPTDPAFGASRFAVDDAPFLEAHSSYFQAGSTSLHNLAAIVLGEDDRVVESRN